jgi:hypothetical protein
MKDNINIYSIQFISFNNKFIDEINEDQIFHKDRKKAIKLANKKMELFSDEIIGYKVIKKYLVI